MKVKLYTTHCPKCKILEERLNEKKVKFEVIDNMEELQKMNFKSVPNLEIDGKIYNYLESIKYLNKLKWFKSIRFTSFQNKLYY